MSSSTSFRNQSQSSLPDDIFSYSNEQFYDFIKKSYGDDLHDLFSFQSIRNGLHLLKTSCEEILLIFEEESEEIEELKKLCCYKTSTNQYGIKLGVKLAINSLIDLLKIKLDNSKRRRINSVKRKLSNVDASQSIDQTQSQTTQHYLQHLQLKGVIAGT